MARQRIGSRRHVASAKQHNQTQDEHGNPTYSTDDDWSTIVEGWPCELLTTRGGEVIRGRQVSESTTHVLFGEYFGGKDITADMVVTVDAVDYAVVTGFDPDGDKREFRVEVKRET